MSSSVLLRGVLSVLSRGQAAVQEERVRADSGEREREREREGERERERERDRQTYRTDRQDIERELSSGGNKRQRECVKTIWYCLHVI
jgi:hypothetical protein